MNWGNSSTYINAATADHLYFSGTAINTATMHRVQADALNPKVEQCGSLPECEGCLLPLVYRTRPDMDNIGLKESHRIGLIPDIVVIQRGRDNRRENFLETL